MTSPEDPREPEPREQKRRDANHGDSAQRDPEQHGPANLSFGAQSQQSNADYYAAEGFDDYEHEHEKSPKYRPTELDYEADPLLRLERNNRSTRQAIWFFFSIIILTFISAFAIWIASQAGGGPYCDADETAILCSDLYRWLFAIIPPAISMFGLFGGAWIAYLKWRSHQRWRPWIAVIWFIMPFSIAWVVSVGAIAIGR